MGPFAFVGSVFTSTATIVDKSFGSMAKVLDGVDEYAGAFVTTGKICNAVLDVEGQIVVAQSNAKLAEFKKSPTE